MILYALFTCALVHGVPGTDCTSFGGSMVGTVQNPAATLEDCLQLRSKFLDVLKEQRRPADDETSKELVCQKKMLPDWEPVR